MTDDRSLGRIEMRPGEPFGLDDAKALRDGTRARQTSSLALYRLARVAGTLGDVVVTSFRCAQARCLLLDIFHTPVGLAAYKPPVRFSPEHNSGTDPGARVERTTDGDRRWVESADLLLPDHLEYWVSCDHILNAVITAEQASEAATRRTATVLIQSDAMR